MKSQTAHNFGDDGCPLQDTKICMQDCGGLTMASCQTPTHHPLTSPPQQDEGENKMKKLVDSAKDGQVAYLFLSLAKQTQLGGK